MEHSRGNWNIDNCPINGLVITNSDESSAIAFIPVLSENSDGNAKLIAAAPDLLSALQKICEMNYQQAEDQYRDREKAKEWACVKVAESAINKALGR